MTGCPMYIVFEKLKRLKKELKLWNKDIFGNVHKQVEQAQAEVDSLQDLMQNAGCTDQLIDKEKQAQISLQRALHFQEEF